MRVVPCAVVAALLVVGVGTAAAVAAVPGDDHDDRFEPNDRLEDAATVHADTYDDLVIGYRDGDFYRTYVSRGDHLLVSVHFERDFAEDGVTVYGPDGTVRYPDGQQAGDWPARIVAGESGYYVVEVRGDRPARSTYRLSLAEIPRDEFEPNDDRTAAASIEPGEYDGLGLQSGERDYYAVEAAADQELRVRTSPVELSGRGANVTVYGPDGDVVAAGEGYSPGEDEDMIELDGYRASVDSTRSGTYYVEVSRDDEFAASYDLSIEVASSGDSRAGPLGVGWIWWALLAGTAGLVVWVRRRTRPDSRRGADA